MAHTQRSSACSHQGASGGALAVSALTCSDRNGSVRFRKALSTVPSRRDARDVVACAEAAKKKGPCREGPSGCAPKCSGQNTLIVRSVIIGRDNRVTIARRRYMLIVSNPIA